MQDRSHDWMGLGACLDLPSVTFFPTSSGDLRAAKACCAGCAVRSQCLEYALEYGIRNGIWGGVSERERGRIARERNLAGGPSTHAG